MPNSYMFCFVINISKCELSDWTNYWAWNLKFDIYKKCCLSSFFVTSMVVQCDGHDKFSENLIHRNVKRFTCSTSAHVSRQGCVSLLCSFLESTICSLVLLKLSTRLFSVQHFMQIVDFLLTLIVACKVVDDGGVIHILNTHIQNTFTWYLGW